MKRDIEEKLTNLIKSKKYTTIDVIKADISYMGFVKRGSADYEEVAESFANKILEIFKVMAHPTLNPVIDEILEYDEKDGPRGLKLYVEDNMKVVRRHDIDNTSEGVEVSVPMTVMMINILAFIDDPDVKVIRGVIQTLLSRDEVISDFEAAAKITQELEEAKFKNGYQA